MLLVVGLTACSGPGENKREGNDGSIYGLNVSGKVGTEPTVRMAPPLEVTRTQTQVVVAGTGEPVQIDQLFVIELTLYDARNGKRIASTYATGEKPLLAKNTDDSLFPALAEALVGLRQGSRLVVALPGAAAYGSVGVPPKGVRLDDPVVAIADVLAVPPADLLTRAEGAAVDVPAGLPRVEVLAEDPIRVDVPSGPSPTELTVVPLVEGTGPVVRDRSLVTIDYLGQVWGRPGPFLDTYFKEPAVVPVGAELSVPAWDEALVGVRQGSRLLVIAPGPQPREPQVVSTPARGTICWVIDVLGVS